MNPIIPEPDIGSIAMIIVATAGVPIAIILFGILVLRRLTEIRNLLRGDSSKGRD